MVSSLQTLTQNQIYIRSVEPLKRITEVIAEIAIRVFFIITCISMASSYAPLSFQAVVLPVVATGAAFLSAFFFLGEPKELIDPPAAISSHAPRGIVNQNNDCAFIAMSQMFDSEPQVVEWIRLSINESRDAFFKFLRSYNVSEEIFGKFSIEGASLFTDQFLSFLKRENPALVEKFTRIFQGQICLHEYWKAFDLAKTQNFAFADANSAGLRWIVHQIFPSLQSNPNSAIQVDVQEVLNAVVDILPDAQKMNIQETYTYNMEDKVPILGQDGHVHSTLEPHSFLSVAIVGSPPNLREMLYAHTQENLELERRTVEKKTELYSTRIQRGFLTFPSSLRIHIKRFSNMSTKRDDSIDIPEQINVSTQDGKRPYRLVSFINHVGDSIAKGHYISARIVNGDRFLIDNENVTLVDPSNWKNLLQKAYLLCYLPAPDGSS